MLGPGSSGPHSVAKAAHEVAKVLVCGSGNRGSIEPGYRNRNGQVVVHATHQAGTDHYQYVYVLRCGHCGNEYGANGSDIFQRKCPNCQGGAPGLLVR